MAQKIVVTVPNGLHSEDAKRRKMADLLCVSPDDLLLVPDGLTVSVVDIPDDLISNREKADKKAAAEREKAESAAAPSAEVGAEPAKADYDGWTVEELHAEAARRDLPGRSGLNKAELVKALHKADKG